VDIQRYVQIARPAMTLAEASDQIQTLRRMLMSAIQDISVLRQVMKDANLMGDANYRRLRIERMVQDHSSCGGNSWRNDCSYKHSLEEEEFLREELLATGEEVEAFRKRVRYVTTLT
jgi:hypothetical protein